MRGRALLGGSVHDVQGCAGYRYRRYRDLIGQSSRSACIGSIRAARQVGNAAAGKPVRPNAAAANANIPGSYRGEVQRPAYGRRVKSYR